MLYIKTCITKFVQKELLAGGCYKEDMTEDKVVRLV